MCSDVTTLSGGLGQPRDRADSDVPQSCSENWLQGVVGGIQRCRGEPKHKTQKNPTTKRLRGEVLALDQSESHLARECFAVLSHDAAFGFDIFYITRVQVSAHVSNHTVKLIVGPLGNNV
jgi:hypothetical protein